MRRITYILAIASLLTSSPAASSNEVSDRDRFQLWNYCLPVELLVETLDQDAADIGLTEEAITIAVRSRLRAARLYDVNASRTLLYVNVLVTNHAYGVDLTYHKWFDDMISGGSGFAMTWSTGSIGTHAENAGFILSSLSRHTDRFVDEYLRVNAASCDD